LRHGGCFLLIEELLLYRKYYITVIISWTMSSMKACLKISVLLCVRPIWNSNVNNGVFGSVY